MDKPENAHGISHFDINDVYDGKDTLAEKADSLCWEECEECDDGFHCTRAVALGTTIERAVKIGSLYQELYDTSSDDEEYQEPRNALDDCKKDPISSTFVRHSTCSNASETGGSPTTLKQEDMPTCKTMAGLLDAQQEKFHRRENSWNSSWTWASDEQKERDRWKNIRKNMRYNGMDQSPFVPRTFEGYIELRLETSMLSKKMATEQLRQREDHTAMLGRNLSAGKPLEQLVGDLTTPECLLDPAKTPSGLFGVIYRNCPLLSSTSEQHWLPEHDPREMNIPTQEFELDQIHYRTRELIEDIRNMD
ncbi:hypothetical protein ANO14919_115560 [Xylariales sp. No.14919]|nr:hypothetical protein ANO14919_115560 [Xylariales sp. No.14919]